AGGRAVGSMTPLLKDLYTATATATGGRSGRAVSSDGQLDVPLAPPKEVGGTGAGPNPEQLFAAGYAACFESALGVVARRLRVDITGSSVTADVTLGNVEGGLYGIKVRLHT